MKHVAKELSVNNFEDWAKVRVSDIIERGGASLLKRYGHSLANILARLFPDESKNISLNKGVYTSKAQQHLLKLLKDIFPNHEILTKYSHPVFQGNAVNMKFDFYLPDLVMAIEYRSEIDYNNTRYGTKDASSLRVRAY